MSPLLVPDQELIQLPTILLFTTEFDIVRDEGKFLSFNQISFSCFR
jgi:hypothetical protein